MPVLEPLGCAGGESEVRTICLFALCALKATEEAFDRLLLVADELDVVDKEDVEFAVAAVERLDLRVIRLIEANPALMNSFVNSSRGLT